MHKRTSHNQTLLAATIGIALLGGGCLGLGGKKKQPDTNASAEPDKVLFDRAMDDQKHSRYTVERLSLQTLINTYPDSEYLAKAKLAIADSYFKEGGTSGLTQSVQEYKDFITFFPFLDEATYAQMQVAMAHYRLMEKPDRDRTQARDAEAEFQTFLLKYPQSPLASQAEQRLRDVQEVLAEGDYRVAHYYYIKDSYRAAAARLQEMTDRYPLYSQSDHALWMLADVYSRSGRTEEEKKKSREIADQYYARIVRDYPLSPLAAGAKRKLADAGQPIPQPDPTALARMQKEQESPRHRTSMFKRSLGLLKTGPDVSTAARNGAPDLNPPGEPTAATDVLKPGAAPSIGTGGGGSNGVSVETVSGGSSGNAAPSPDPASTGGSPPTGGTETPATGNPPAINAPAAGATPAAGASPTTGSAPATDASADDSSSTDQKKDDKSKDDKESSSKKKKKGLRKLIPW